MLAQHVLEDARTGPIRMRAFRHLGQLQRVEVALGQSLTRSDEQLAYYVAQAREIIDLSLLSQKQVVDDLQRLAGRGAGGAEPA